MLKQDAGLTCRRSHNRAAKEGKLLRKGKVQEKNGINVSTLVFDSRQFAVGS